MSPTTTFLIGLFVGSWMGIFSAALAAVAKTSDHELKRWYE
jgi:hypothetical protein